MARSHKKVLAETNTSLHYTEISEHVLSEPQFPSIHIEMVTIESNSGKIKNAFGSHFSYWKIRNCNDARYIMPHSNKPNELALLK